MGCEFSDRVRVFKRQMVKELFDKLIPQHKNKFIQNYGNIETMKEVEFYSAYHHCKRVLNHKRMINSCKPT